MPDEQEAPAFPETAAPEVPEEFPEPVQPEPPEPPTEEPAPVEQEPDVAPETIDVMNEASREPATITLSRGPGDTIRVEDGDYSAIITKENFGKIIEWFNGLGEST